MVTVHRDGGFRVVIYPGAREPGPPHAHVFNAYGEAKVSMGDAGEAPALLLVVGMRKPDAVRALWLVKERQEPFSPGGGITMARSWKPATEAEIERQYAEAVEAGRAADEAGPRAASVRYDRGTRRVEVEPRNGCLFAFPAEMEPGLLGASPDELAAVEVTPGGNGVEDESPAG